MRDAYRSRIDENPLIRRMSRQLRNHSLRPIDTSRYVILPRSDLSDRIRFPLPRLLPGRNDAMHIPSELFLERESEAVDEGRCAVDARRRSIVILFRQFNIDSFKNKGKRGNLRSGVLGELYGESPCCCGVD